MNNAPANTWMTDEPAPPDRPVPNAWMEQAHADALQRDANLAQVILRDNEQTPELIDTPQMREKMEVAKVYASHFQMDPAAVIRNFDVYAAAYAKQSDAARDKGASKAITDNASLGQVYVDIARINSQIKTMRDYLATDLSTMQDSYGMSPSERSAWPKKQAEIQAQIMEKQKELSRLKAKLPAYADDRERGFFIDQLKALAQTAPGLADMVVKAASGAALAVATGGAAGGSLAVGMAFGNAGAAGGMILSNAEQTGGTIYGDLMDAGANHEIASMAANLGVYLTSPLALAQVNLATKVVGGPLEGAIGKVVKNAVSAAIKDNAKQFATKRTLGAMAAKIGLDYTGRLAGQELLTAAQSIATDLSYNFGALLENNLRNSGLDSRTVSEIAERAGAAMRDSLLTMAVIELFPTAVGGVRGMRKVGEAKDTVSQAAQFAQKVPQADPALVRAAILDRMGMDDQATSRAEAAAMAGNAKVQTRHEAFIARQLGDDADAKTKVVDADGAPAVFYHARAEADGIHLYESADDAAALADGLTASVHKDDLIKAVTDKYGRDAADYLQAKIEGKDVTMTPAIERQMGDAARRLEEATAWVRHDDLDLKQVPDSVVDTFHELGLDGAKSHLLPAYIDAAAIKSVPDRASLSEVDLTGGEVAAIGPVGRREIILKDASKLIPLDPEPVVNYRLPKRGGKLITDDTGAGFHALDPASRDRVASLEYSEGNVITSLPENPRIAAELLAEYKAQKGKVVLDVPVETRDAIARTNPERRPLVDALNEMSGRQRDLLDSLESAKDDAVALAERQDAAIALAERMEAAERELAAMDADYLGERIPEVWNAPEEVAQVVEAKSRRVIETMHDLDGLIKEYAPNINRDERQAALSLVRVRAAAMGLSADAWASRYIRDVQHLDTPAEMLRAPRGGVSFVQGLASEAQAIIHLSEASDATTLVHELGHIVRRQLPESDQLKLLKHYGESGWNTKAEEAFASDWEAYFHEGKAPTEELSGLFAKIRHFFGRIYSSLSRTIHPEVRDVINRALTKVGEHVPETHANELFQPAYHGSPHRFDQFTTDAMGSGEGAQAYGWGMYFAGNKEVAEWYRRELSSGLTIDGQPFFVRGKQKGSTGNVTADDYLMANFFFPNEAVAELKKDLAEVQEYGGDTGDYQKALSILENLLLEGRIKNETGGQLYKVEIPDDAEYLDWDKPLTEQTTTLRELVGKFFTLPSQADMEAAGRAEVDQVSRVFRISRAGDYWVAWVGKQGSIGMDYKEVDRFRSPSPAHDWLRDKYNATNFSGETFYDLLATKLGGPRAASMALKEAGIPGIRYLDGSSRDAGEGNHNYVIFDDSDVEITETYYQLDDQDPAKLLDLIDRIDQLDRDYADAQVDFSMTTEQQAANRQERDGLVAQKDDIKESLQADIQEAVEAGRVLPKAAVEAYRGEAWADDYLAFMDAMGIEDITPLADEAAQAPETAQDRAIEAKDAELSGEALEADPEPIQAPKTREEANAAWAAKVQADGEQMIKMLRGIYSDRKELLNAETAHFLDLDWGGPVWQAIHVSKANAKRKAEIDQAAIGHLAKNGDRYRKTWARFVQDTEELQRINELDAREPLPEAVNKPKPQTNEERIALIRELLDSGMRDKTNAESEAAYRQVSAQLTVMSKTNNAQLKNISDLDSRLNGMTSYMDKLSTRIKHLDHALSQAERQEIRDEKTIAQLKADKAAIRKQATARLADTVASLESVKGAAMDDYRASIAILKGKIEDLRADAVATERWRDAEANTMGDAHKGKLKAQEEAWRAHLDTVQEEFGQQVRGWRDALQSARQEAQAQTDMVRAQYREQARQRRLREYKANLMAQALKKPGSGIAFEYAEAIRQIQSLYSKDTFGDVRGNRREKMRAYFESHPELKENLSPAANGFMAKKTMDELTLADVENIASQVEFLRDLGRRKQELRTSREKIEADYDIMKLKSAVITGTSRPQKPFLPEDRPADKKRVDLKRLFADGVTPQRLFDSLDGGMDYKGPWMDTYNKVSDRAAEAARRVSERLDAYKAEVERLGIDMTRMNKTLITLPNGRSFTAQEALGVWAAMRNDRAREALMHGNRLASDEITSIIGALDDKMIELGHWIIDHGYGDHADRLREAYINYKNEDMPLEENYTPIMRFQMDGMPLFRQIEDDLFRQAPTLKAGVARSMTKSRIDIAPKYQTPMRLDLLTIFSTMVPKQEQFINLAPQVKHWQRVFRDQDLRNHVASVYDAETMHQVDEWLARVANPDATAGKEAIDGVVNFLRSNAALAYLAYSQVTAVKAWLTGTLYSMAEAPGRVISETVRAGYGANIPYLLPKYRKMCTLSPEMKDRTISPAFADLQKANAKRFVTLHKINQKYAYIMLQWGQRYVDTVCWTATFDHFRAQGMTMHDASRQATNFILRTQPVGDAKDTSKMMHHRGLASAFTLFAGQGNQLWNEISPAKLLQTLQNPKLDRKAKLLAARKYGTLLAGATIGSGIYALFAQKQIPQDEEDWKKFALDTANTTFTSNIPWIGPIISSLAAGFAGSEIQALTPISGVAAGAQGALKILEDGADEKKVKRTVYSLWEAAAVGLGTPYLAPKRIVEMATDEEAWPSENPDWWKTWAQYLIVGGKPRN